MCSEGLTMTLLLLLKKVKGVEVTSQELGSGGWGLGLAVRFLFEQAKCLHTVR